MHGINNSYTNTNTTNRDETRVRLKYTNQSFIPAGFYFDLRIYKCSILTIKSFSSSCHLSVYFHSLVQNSFTGQTLHNNWQWVRGKGWLSVFYNHFILTNYIQTKIMSSLNLSYISEEFQVKLKSQNAFVFWTFQLILR